MRRSLGAVAIVLLTAAAAAGDPAALRSLFPKEADVTVDGTGLARLDLPVEVLADCLPNLSNVRLFDLQGNEVPFLVDSPRVDAVVETRQVEARPLEARREEVPRANGPSLRRETFELPSPVGTAPSGGWTLVLDVARPEFVARARVTWSRPGGASQEQTTGSIFRLLSPRRVEKLHLPIGAVPGAKVTVLLEHEQPFWLEPSFRYVSSLKTDRVASAVIPLPILSVRSAAGVTTVELARPPGVVPASLRLGSSTATFDRKLTVHDLGTRGDTGQLGSASLFRLQPGSGVEALEMPLRAARGERLRVEIEDGDSPPLAGIALTAVFGQPSLVAYLQRPETAGAAATLCFGGRRASVPRYDLAGLRPPAGREVYGQRAEALLRLYDPGAVHEAHLGMIRPNPAFDPAPALAFAMRSGASIDRSSFARRRLLDVRPSPEGLARLRLAPEDLAALRPDLADLRIVDSQDRQWPYLVERGAASTEVTLTAAATSKNRATTYRLSAGVAPLTLDRLVVDTDLAFFDRAFRLTGVPDGGAESVMAQGRLTRSAPDLNPVEIDFPAARLTRLELRIDDGDDAPLPVRALRGRCPVPDVFVAAPAGPYSLLAGGEGTAAPRYELERVRDVILAVEAGEIRTRALEANPGFRVSTRFTHGRGPQQTIVWIAIVAAVVVLAAITLRLARQGPAS
jgi:hypothetical protein